MNTQSLPPPHPLPPALRHHPSKTLSAMLHHPLHARRRLHRRHAHAHPYPHPLHGANLPYTHLSHPPRPLSDALSFDSDALSSPPRSPPDSLSGASSFSRLEPLPTPSPLHHPLRSPPHQPTPRSLARSPPPYLQTPPDPRLRTPPDRRLHSPPAAFHHPSQQTPLTFHTVATFRVSQTTTAPADTPAPGAAWLRVTDPNSGATLISAHGEPGLDVDLFDAQGNTLFTLTPAHPTRRGQPQRAVLASASDGRPVMITAPSQRIVRHAERGAERDYDDDDDEHLSVQSADHRRRSPSPARRHPRVSSLDRAAGPLRSRSPNSRGPHWRDVSPSGAGLRRRDSPRPSLRDEWDDLERDELDSLARYGSDPGGEFSDPGSLQFAPPQDASLLQRRRTTGWTAYDGRDGASFEERQWRQTQQMQFTNVGNFTVGRRQFTSTGQIDPDYFQRLHYYNSPYINNPYSDALTGQGGRRLAQGLGHGQGHRRGHGRGHGSGLRNESGGSLPLGDGARGMNDQSGAFVIAEFHAGDEAGASRRSAPLFRLVRIGGGSRESFQTAYGQEMAVLDYSASQRGVYGGDGASYSLTLYPGVDLSVITASIVSRLWLSMVGPPADERN